MDKYISKNTILKVLADSEPKEEDWRIDNAENYDLRKIRFLAASNVYEEIKDVLSCDRLVADVTAVVRCWECKNFKSFPDGIYGSCTSFPCRNCVMKTTDYCSYGVKKESED